MTEEFERDVESYARELVFLQCRLIEMLARAFDWEPGSDAISLSKLPRYGTIEEPTTIWGYSQHGTGIRFINIRNLVCVDVDSHLEDGEAFTLWRLQIFMESCGGSEEVLGRVGGAGHEAVSHFASRVAGRADAYRLSERQVPNQ